MSILKVQKIRHTASNTDVIDIANDGTCTANVTSIGGGQLSNRNLIINGAMQVAQRGTSSTSAGYKTIDRMYVGFASTDEAPTITQADISSSDTPYTKGFRKALKIQNGDQSSGAGAANEMQFTYNIEAQDLAQSGWDYTSSSSNITVSFWARSSVAQQFQVNNRLYGPSNNNQREICYEYTLAANTWTKITKTISGHTDNTLRNDNALGMFMMFGLYYGTNYTAPGRAFDQWGGKNNAANFRDFATDWYVADNATFEITGLQVEVGSVATDFEHRSYGDELLKCARYCYVVTRLAVMSNAASGYVSCCSRPNPVPMRASPSLSKSGGITFNAFFENVTPPVTYVTPSLQSAVNDNFVINFSGFSSTVNNRFGDVYGFNYLIMSAEL